MILTREVLGKVIQEKVLSDSSIHEKLKAIEPFLSPYIILESGGRSYIQAAGSLNRMAVEARIYNGDSFNHFVLGRKEPSKVWCIVDCKVGPIRVLENELLNVEDAILLFKEFFKTGEIDSRYNKRNVTKLYR